MVHDSAQGRRNFWSIPRHRITSDDRALSERQVRAKVGHLDQVAQGLASIRRDVIASFLRRDNHVHAGLHVVRQDEIAACTLQEMKTSDVLLILSRSARRLEGDQEDVLTLLADLSEKLRRRIQLHVIAKGIAVSVSCLE